MRTAGGNRGAIPVVNEANLRKGLRYLSERDTELAQILEELGSPPLWAREPGFPTLLHIILEQQVSLASARAAFNRLLAIASPLTPSAFLALDDATLKAVGFSRQKTAYGRCLAEAISKGTLRLDEIHEMDDSLARVELLKLKGIGDWTVDIYLLMALGRPDVWPSGDLALALALQDVKRLPLRPAPALTEEISVPWRPWRAVAARLLWHYYLSKRPAQGRR